MIRVKQIELLISLHKRAPISKLLSDIRTLVCQIDIYNVYVPNIIIKKIISNEFTPFTLCLLTNFDKKDINI